MHEVPHYDYDMITSHNVERQAHLKMVMAWTGTMWAQTTGGYTRTYAHVRTFSNVGD